MNHLDPKMPYTKPLWQVLMGNLNVHILKCRLTKFNITEMRVVEIGIENLSVVKIDLSQRSVAKVSQLDGTIG